MTRLSFKLAREERKHYVLALLSMAGADGQVSDEEKRFLRERCAALKCRLKSWDFKQFDIAKIRDGIQSAEARQALLEDLAQLADSDGRDKMEGLILQSLARAWKLPLPGPAAAREETFPDEEELLRAFSSSRRERFAGNKELQDFVYPPPNWGGFIFLMPVSILGFVMVYFTFIGDTSWVKPNTGSSFSRTHLLRILRGVALFFSFIGVLNIFTLLQALKHRR